MADNKTNKWFMLALLCLAGATVYTFPFLRYSYYDPMREALGVSHTQMGIMQSINGITSTLGYIPGGWLADRFPARKLLAISLVSTGLSGFYFSTFPSYVGGLFLYGFWGISTLIIFWAPLIKATRDLGEKSEQGRLFGFLEGGRGLIASLIGVLTLAVFKMMGEGDIGLMWVINVSAVITIAAGVAVWFFFTDAEQEPRQSESILGNIKTALAMPKVWVMGLIIFCGYGLFAGQSYTTPYMTGVIGAAVSFGALMGVIRTYGLQTIGGPASGMLSDKIGSPTKVIIAAFAIAAVCMVLFLVIPARISNLNLVAINMVVLGLAVFALRGNYYATFAESDIPKYMTGSAIGVASFVGFLPEAFTYPMIGYWLDHNPGLAGYKITFAYLLCLSLFGFFMSCLLWRMNNPKTTHD